MIPQSTILDLTSDAGLVDQAARLLFDAFRGRVWEIHPLVVRESHRGRGIGRALIEDLEQLAAQRGALTLWAGSDDAR